MSPRIIVRIELTPNAKARLNECTDKAGMTQVAMLSRLVEWFANQIGPNPSGRGGLVIAR